MYLAGMIMMAWNLVKTARAGKAVDGTTTWPSRPGAPQRGCRSR